MGPRHAFGRSTVCGHSIDLEEVAYPFAIIEHASCQNRLSKFPCIDKGVVGGFVGRKLAWRIISLIALDKLQTMAGHGRR